jgi:hypothetical protein
MLDTATQCCHPESTDDQVIPGLDSITSASAKIVSPLPTPINQKSVNLTPPVNLTSVNLTPSRETHAAGVYWHRDGCNEPAFLFKKIPLPTDLISDTTEFGMHTNGDPILSCDLIACDSCGEQLRIDYNYIEEF